MRSSHGCVPGSGTTSGSGWRILPEHWKTARTALLRIQAAFAEIGLRPKSFFVGSAIEAKMAEEIWKLLSNGQLDNAANLTSNQQLDHLARWLCSL